MTDVCAAKPESTGFIGSMTHFIDCQSQVLGSNAYQALSMPGSTLQLVLTGFLTIFIAIIGYNLLFGRSFTVRWGTLAAVKLGAVFALATSWPAYRTLVYDLVTDGPAQIVSDIGRPAGVPGADGALVQRLDAADGALVELSVLGPGIPTVLQQQNVPPPPFAGFNAFALGGSRILFLLTAVAGLGSIRLITGLMLALGPFFVAFLMFDNTRSLFEGWVRVLAGTAIAAVGLSIVLGLELLLIEPWLSTILARRLAGEALPSVPAELFVVTMTFAIIVLSIMAACARLARGFRLAPLVHHLEGSRTEAAIDKGLTVFGAAPETVTREERSRAAVVADVLVAMQRREGSRGALTSPRHAGVPLANAPGAAAALAERSTVPVGRALTRRAQNKASASAGRRDSL